MNIEQEIAELKNRNARVEAEKAWEVKRGQVLNREFGSVTKVDSPSVFLR